VTAGGEDGEVGRHDGRDIASINAFCDAADGLSETVVIAVTGNGESICGGYLDSAWREGDWILDNGRSGRRFLFTLNNHAGSARRRGAIRTRPSSGATAYCLFGRWEGPYIFEGGNPGGGLGFRSEDVVGGGPGDLQRRAGPLPPVAVGALAGRVRPCCDAISMVVSWIATALGFERVA
jgi:hypothetical protein